MTVHDDVLEKHRRELVNAETAYGNSEAKLKNCLEKSFLDPEKARTRIDKYQARNPGNAIYDKLAENPRDVSRFGRRPGSLLSGDFFKPGASQRRQESIIERQNLAPLLKQRSADRQRFEGAQRAYQDALAQGSGQGSGQTPATKPRTIAADQHRTPRVVGHMPAQGQSPTREQPEREAYARQMRSQWDANRAKEKEKGQGR